jgi:hypothetical protein
MTKISEAEVFCYISLPHMYFSNDLYLSGGIQELGKVTGRQWKQWEFQLKIRVFQEAARKMLFDISHANVENCLLNILKKSNEI